MHFDLFGSLLHVVHAIHCMNSRAMMNNILQFLDQHAHGCVETWWHQLEGVQIMCDLAVQCLSWWHEVQKLYAGLFRANQHHDHGHRTQWLVTEISCTGKLLQYHGIWEPDLQWCSRPLILLQMEALAVAKTKKRCIVPSLETKMDPSVTPDTLYKRARTWYYTVSILLHFSLSFDRNLVGSPPGSWLVKFSLQFA